MLGRLYLVLADWVRRHPPSEAFLAPIDVILSDDTVVQPDLLVVLDPHSVSGRGIERAPALAVEILSPTSRERDRTLKRERYGRAGVAEYWVVDPNDRTIEQYASLQIAGSRCTRPGAWLTTCTRWLWMASWSRCGPRSRTGERGMHPLLMSRPA